MTSNHVSLWDLEVTELDYLTINTSQLEIAIQLFPNLIHPRVLTTYHIKAINANISSHFDNTDSIMPVDPSALIKQAVAFGQYRNSLQGIQFEPKDSRELFNHFVHSTPGMNISQYCECVKNWCFIEKLQDGGQQAQKQILEDGWTAFSLVPHDLKLAFGLTED